MQLFHISLSHALTLLLYLQSCMNMDADAKTHTCKHTHIPTHMQTHTHTNTHAHTHTTYMHTHIHTHTHIHLHTGANILQSSEYGQVSRVEFHSCHRLAYELKLIIFKNIRKLGSLEYEWNSINIFFSD